MKKIFCDGCDKGIERNYVSNRLEKELMLGGQKFGIQVMVSKDSCWDDGDLCLDCLLKVINEGVEK